MVASYICFQLEIQLFQLFGAATLNHDFLTYIPFSTSNDLCVLFWQLIDGNPCSSLMVCFYVCAMYCFIYGKNKYSIILFIANNFALSTNFFLNFYYITLIAIREIQFPGALTIM